MKGYGARHCIWGGGEWVGSSKTEFWKFRFPPIGILKVSVVAVRRRFHQLSETENTMSVKKLIQQFINANRKAYTTASSVFGKIETEDFATTLLEAGITVADIEAFATAYVHEKTGVNPHPSQRDHSKLVFKKDSSEYNRVKYLVDVATGVRQARAARKPSKPPVKHMRVSREHRAWANDFIAQFEGKTKAEQIKAAIALLNAI